MNSFLGTLLVRENLSDKLLFGWLIYFPIFSQCSWLIFLCLKRSGQLSPLWKLKEVFS